MHKSADMVVFGAPRVGSEFETVRLIRTKVAKGIVRSWRHMRRCHIVTVKKYDGLNKLSLISFTEQEAKFHLVRFGRDRSGAALTPQPGQGSNLVQPKFFFMNNYICILFVYFFLCYNVSPSLCQPFEVCRYVLYPSGAGRWLWNIEFRYCTAPLSHSLLHRRRGSLMHAEMWSP